MRREVSWKENIAECRHGAARLGRTREAVVHFQDMLRVAWRLDLPAKGGVAHDRIIADSDVIGDADLPRQHHPIARRADRN